MTERDNIRMEINIAGEPMLLTVPFDRQSAVRDIEEQTNMLYRNWRARFPKKTNTPPSTTNCSRSTARPSPQ